MPYKLPKSLHVIYSVPRNYAQDYVVTMLLFNRYGTADPWGWNVHA